MWTEWQTLVKTLPSLVVGNNIEEPVPQTKKILHCAVKFEAGEENRIVYESLY